MACARCGCCIYDSEDVIAVNKSWHKNCFTCYNCDQLLNKTTVKLFQGEPFCQCCYTGVIEKLFEVISTPSLNKPCKVVSTPSCAVSQTFLELLKPHNCKSNISCEKEYCFPAEKTHCGPKTAQSCDCIQNKEPAKNEYCFNYPIPREVANYYNRAHMKSTACKNPVSCRSQPRCPACSCRKSCEPSQKCCVQIKTLKCRPCCCRTSCPPSYCPGPNSAKKSCCPKPRPPSPCTPVFTAGCNGCCLPTEPVNCQHCCQSKKECYQHKFAAPPQPVYCSSCQQKCCPPVKWCPPKQCCRPKGAPCCEQTPICQCQCEYTGCPKYCVCGNLNPCNCKISQIRAQCAVCCNRCNRKVYAAEKIQVSSGAYHTSCFTCFCCGKCLDVKNVYEGCGEIYCKQCYNHFFGIQCYGFGTPNC